MKIKAILAILFFFSSVFVIWSFGKPLPTDTENLTQKEMENFLKTARIIPDQKGVGGRTESWSVTIYDGKTKMRGFAKFTDRHRPHPVPDSYKYGIATYELNKLLDLDFIPPIVEREIEGRKASLMPLFEGVINERSRRRQKLKPPDLKSFENTMDELKVFENLIYSSALCEEGGDDLNDLLIAYKKDWKVWRVDLSEAFAPIPELIQFCEFTRCSRKLYKNLLKLDDEVIKAKLEHYLNDEEMSALLERKKLIVEKIKQLIKEKGEDSVLFFPSGEPI
jgi:hypothetical protein